MKRCFLFTITLILLAFTTIAQKHTITGTITDASTGESLIGVNILFKQGVGVVTNFEGKYTFEIESGEYNVTVSYVGYDKITQKITINSSITKNFKLNPTILDEVRIVADVAIARKTPVAFTNLEPKQIQEDLASQDIPMLLNSTPGVYATQEGGGDGDAQVTIRGFSSRNVGVLLDGVPVNDMENGHVYWSNWFGLDVATRSIQVQRGLGASKLALPSVGGTINIITKGFDNKKEGILKQEVGNDGLLRTTASYNTGKLKGDWAISIAGSYKRGNGWVDQTWTEGFFYYLKIDKKIGKHLISLSGFGAPQSHAQRSYKLPVSSYDKEYAKEIGITDEEIATLESAGNQVDMGTRYNQHWGYLQMEGDNEQKIRNERINQYHKPQFTLKDSWNVNDKLFISNILYMSIGRGGGERAKKTPTMVDSTGQMDFQLMYLQNQNINTNYHPTDKISTKPMRILKNEHNWFGLVTTANYKFNSLLTFSGGIDLRSYKGTHYEEVGDLLGGDYTNSDYTDFNNADWTQDYPLEEYILREGDKNNFHNDGLVRWGGLFLLTELDFGKLNSFINITGSSTGYKRIDHFYGLNKNVKQKETDWVYIPGYTIKGGANYLVNENINVFANLGYLNKAPRFNNVYDYDNTKLLDINNESIKAIELGSSYKTRIFSANINAYYTVWQDKPADRAHSVTIDDNEYSVNIRGMDALHKGVEFDFVFKPWKKVSFQGLISMGDWRWQSEDSVGILDDNRNVIDTVYYNAKDVHVGNSAQTQFSAEIRFEPIKKMYIKLRGTYFDRYYAQFNPLDLDNPNEAPDSWKVPSYFLLDLHAGYGFNLANQRFQIRGSVLNLLNTTYISSAQDNDTYNEQKWDSHDARSASVFYGLGRRYNVSLQYSF